MKYVIFILVLVAESLSAQLMVDINPENSTICQTSNVVLTAEVSGQIGTISYLWSNNGGSMSQANFAGSSLSIGSNKIYVTVTEEGGSVVIDSSTIMVVAASNAGMISGVDIICKDSIGEFTATVSSGIWSSLNPSVAAVNNLGEVTGKAAGITTIRYTVLGSSPCPDVSATKSLTVNAPPTPAIINGPTTLCFNVPDTLTATVGGGSWSALDPTVATINVNGIITTISPGKARFRYTISGNGICTDAVKEHLVEILPLPLKPTVQITNPTTCGGTNGSIRLLASEYIASSYLVNYTFNNVPVQKEIAPLNNIIEITNLASGVYKINSIKNVLTGCQLNNINESRTLTDPPRPVNPEIAVDKLTSCGPATFNFSTPQVSGFTYSWKLDGNPQFPSTNVYNPNLTTVKKYIISLTQTQTTTNCISDISTKDVEVFTPVNATISGKTEVCEGYDEVISAMANTGSGEYTYKWSTGETTAIKDLKTLADGFYSFKVTITDKNNCTNAATKEVAVNDVPELKIKQLSLFSFDLDGSYPNVIEYKYKIANITLNKDTITSYSNVSSLIFGFDGISSYDVQMIFKTNRGCEGISQTIRVDPNPVECADAKIEVVLPDDNKLAFLSTQIAEVKYCEKFIMNLYITGGIKDKILMGDVTASAKNVVKLPIILEMGIFKDSIKGVEIDQLINDSIKLDFNFVVPNTGSAGTKTIPCKFIIKVINDFKPEVVLDLDNFCYKDTIKIPIKEKSGKKTNFVLDKDGKNYKLPDILDIPLKIEKNESAATSFMLKSIKAENNICPDFNKTYTINIKKSPVIPQTTDTVCNSIDYKTYVFYDAGVDYKWSYKGNSVSLPFTGSTLESDKYNVTATLTYGTLICANEASINFIKDQPATGRIQSPGDCSPFFTVNTSDILNNTTLTWLYNNSTSNITFPFSTDKRIVSLSSMQAGGKLLLKLQRGTCEYKDSISGSENFYYEEDLREIESFNCGDGQIYLIPDVDNDCFNWYTYDSTSLELMKVNEIEDVPFVAVDKNLKILVTAVDCNDNCSGTIFNRIKQGEKDCEDKTTASSYKVYPVPALDKITIERNQKNWGTLSARLCDLTGRTIKSIELDDQNSEKFELDVSDVLPGLYFLNIEEVNYKIIINR
ncbi:MAG: Ig-like domain-containing protein [Saprospiraceae bacterium]|nr:Ig-like domain-containing protein [Saprospiraceae bacterium]